MKLSLVLASSLLAALVVSSAQAQTPYRRIDAAPLEARCPEGRALNGRCVNPRLAFLMRQQACAFSQPKLSFIAPPCILPSGTGVIPVDNATVDRNYRYPNNTVTNPNPQFDFLFERRRYNNVP